MDSANVVHLPDAPIISGLSFRRLQGDDDYSQMAAVHSGSQAWDRVDPVSARESVPTADSLAANFPLAEMQANPDLLLVQIEQTVVGYSHVLWRWTEVTGMRVYLHLGYLLPQWRGKGIGRAMLQWSQARIRELAVDDPHVGPITFATNVSSTEQEAAHLMQHAGYQAVRRLSDMVLTPLTPVLVRSLPPTVVLRPIEPEHYPAIYKAWKNAFAELWTSTTESEADYQAFLADNIHVSAFDPALCQVAWVQDDVVGFVFGRIGKGVGTIPEVAVRKAWQRQGIAHALMVQTLNRLYECGITQVRLFTDAEDSQGARSLYERLGFHEVKQHIFYRKPLNS